MESFLSSSSTHILEGLDYRSRSVASYVERRSEVTFFPSGNVFASNGVRSLIFTMSGSGYIDLSSLHLKCLVSNLDATKSLTPITPDGTCLFSELIIIGHQERNWNAWELQLRL